MSQSLMLKAKGLFTNVNELSQVPEGAMLIADNVVINRDGIVETRRGISQLVAGFFDPTFRAKSLFNYQGYILAHYGFPGIEQYIAYYDNTTTILSGTTVNTSTTVTFGSTALISPGMLITGTGLDENTYVLTVDSPTAITITTAAIASGTHNLSLTGWRNYAGTYFVPDTLLGRIRSVEASGNFYFTTSTGIKKLDSISGTIVSAGGIPALDGQASLPATIGGFFQPNTQVGYRIVWGYKDANNNIILGNPSQRIIIANTSLTNSYNVNVTFTVPEDVTVNYFYQAYRSGMSANAQSQPNDEMNLVFEDNPTSAELLAGTITILDETPEQLRNGAALYTSPSQEGILQENDEPPFAKDIAFFRNCVFYANTKTKQNLFLTMLGVGGSLGVNYLNVHGDITSGSNKVINAGVNTHSTTGAITTGFTSILNLASLTGISIGDLVFGTGIPSNTAVESIASNITDTGTITNTSTAVVDIATVAPYYIGQNISGTGIPGSTTISSLISTSLAIGDITSSSTGVTNLADTSGYVVGQQVSGANIPAGTVIANIPTSTTITLSLPASATITGAALTFGNVIVISAAATADSTGVTLTFGNVVSISNPSAATNSSASLTFFNQTVNGLAIGETVFGTGIPASTTVTAVIGVVSTTGNITSASPIITNIPSTTGFLTGQSVIGPNIPSGAKILTVDSPTQITLTANAAASTTASPLTLGAIVTMSANATATTTNSAMEFYDSVTIAGNTYRPAAVEDINANKYQFYSDGTPSQNIDNTAQSLVRVINRTPSNTTINAFYESGFNDLPGQILFQERGIGGAVFYATASAHGTAWNPNLPTSGTTVASTNDNFANAIYYSKTLQPEGVPATNSVRVGSADKPIYRIIALRQALFIFKADGIYRLTGLDPTSFRLDLFDNTAKLIAPDTAVTLNNQIFALADQGVIAVGDTGVSIISRPIENLLLQLYSLNLTTLSQVSFGVGYETERLYILGVITNAEDTTSTQQYVYNTFTNTWVRWPVAKTFGIISSGEGKLYYGDALSNIVNVERKDRMYTDYVDSVFTVNLLSYTGNVLVVDDPSGITVGDSMFQDTETSSLVLAVDPTTGQITVTDILVWTLGPIQVLEAIAADVRFVPSIAKNPGSLKHWREISLFFKDAVFSALQVGFTSDLSLSLDTVTFTGISIGNWGAFPWGSAPWGGQGAAFALRTYVPQQKQRCSQLTVDIQHRQAQRYFSLNGLSLIYNTVSEKLTR